MKLGKLFLTCLAFVAFATTNTFAQEDTDDAPSQDGALSVEMKALDGSTVNLKDYVKDGQLTAISFWATWCSPCKKELDNIAEVYEDWQADYDLHIIAISVDDARTFPRVKETVNTKEWEYTVLCDPNSKSYQKFGFDTVPFMMLIDKNGEVVYTHSGYKEGDEADLEEHIIELSE